MVGRSLVRCLESVAEKTLSKSKVTAGNCSDRLPPLPSPRDLLKLYKINAQRNLSQNFLLDHRLTNKIVTTTGKVRGCYVCEVGPGPGNITRSIIQNGAKEITVIEKDRRFLPALQLLADACDQRLKIILGDVMDVSLENVFPKELAQAWNMPCPPFYIIGNLPFNISTPLIIRWLRHCSYQTGPFKYGRTQLTLTFQKEVADRMVANPYSDVRCRLSIMCQYLCNIENLFTVPGRAFFPKPDVDVSVVKFTPLIKPIIHQPFNMVEKVVRTLFQHRQKYCRYGIMHLFPEDRPELGEEILAITKINPEKKSFQLEIEEFKVLCDAYASICGDDEELLNFDFRVPKKIKRRLPSDAESTADEDYVELDETNSVNMH